MNNIDSNWSQCRVLKNILTTLEQQNPDIVSTSEFKKAVLKSMILDIKNKHYQAVRSLINVLKNKNIRWSELKTIEKTLQARDIVVEDEERSLDNATEDEKLKAVKRHWANIDYISNPSKAVQLAAIEQDPKALEYIIEDGIIPSEEVQLAAVIYHTICIKYITDAGIIPSEAVQLAAVKNNSLTIRYILKVTVPSLKVQMAALEDEPWLVKNIDKALHPDMLTNTNFKRAILKELIDSIKNNEINHGKKVLISLKNNQANWPELDIIEKNLKAKLQISESDENTEFDSMSDEEKLEAIRNDGFLIKYIKNPSEEFQLAAVKNEGDWALHWIMEKGIKPSEAVQLAAVEQNGIAIHNILQKGFIPSEAVQLAAIKEHPRAIKYILEHIDASMEVKLFSLQRDPRSVIFFDKEDPVLDNSAVKRHMLQTILYNIKSNNLNYAVGLAMLLKKQNIKWPELDIIEKNVSSKDISESSVFDNATPEEDLRALDDDERFEIIKTYVFGIEYLDNDLITPNIKRFVLSNLLEFIKREDKWYARQLFKILWDKKLNWSELDTIAKTLQAKKIIHESNINTASEADQLAEINKTPYMIAAIDNPSEAVQLAAVTERGDLIRHIKNPSEAVQLAAVNERGYAIQHIKNPSEAVKIAAVTNDPYSIQHIKNPSEAVELAAVKKSVWIIEHTYIKITSAVKRVILNHLIKAIADTRREKYAAQMFYMISDHRFGWPELDIIEKKLKEQNIINESNINTVSEEEQIHDVGYEPELISHIKNPSEAVQLAAVKNDGDVLQFIKNPSEVVQLAAVKNNGYAIQYIENPSEAVQMAAVNDDPYTIRHIENPSEKVQLAALEESVWVIEYFTNIPLAAKRIVLNTLINYVRNNKNAPDLYYILRDKTDWPELATIAKTLKAKNIIDDDENLIDNEGK